MPPAAPDKPARAFSRAKLRILQTTDLHGHVLAYDYHRDVPTRAHGLSLTASLISEARARAPLSLLFDSGDFLQGSPLSENYVGSGQSKDAAHPLVSAMNLLAYDAVTLGNHDLDFGSDYLVQALSQASFPVVSANVTLPELAQKLLRRHVMLVREHPETGDVIKIGVTGCLPHDTLHGAACLNAGLEVAPAGPALTQAVTELKARGADVVVVLAHCGLGTDKANDARETIHNTVSQISGVDVVLGGHTHDVYPTAETEPELLVNGCAVVMAGAWGSHLGQVDLGLSKPLKSWQITTRAAKVLPVAQSGTAPKEVAECAEILRNTRVAHNATRSALSAKVGSTDRQIDSYFALVQNDIGLQLIAEAFADKARRLLTEQLPANSPLHKLPLLSAATPFKTGGPAGSEHYCHIDVGPIAKRNVSSLYSHTDRLCLMHINGACLRAWLEQSACVFNQINAGAQDAPLLDPRFPGYMFDVIPQLTYAINLSQPPRFNVRRGLLNRAAQRIEDLRHNGKLVHDDDGFIISLNSYRAYGAWSLAAGDTTALQEHLLDSGVKCSDVIEQHISAISPMSRRCKASWRFAPVARATASFLTAPEAAHNCPPAFSPIGLSTDGFAKMRLSLA